MLTLSLLSGCGGGGGDSDDEDNNVAISGTILVPGGTVSNDNPIGLTGAANRTVSLYQIDDEGSVIGNVLDSTTSDASGNYVLLLPADIKFSSDIIVEAQLDNNETARAIVIDATTDITPITEYITSKLIEDPSLDLSNLPVDEVTQLIEFVESLPLGPQPDLSSMLVEIASFSDIAIEAEIDDLATSEPQIRLSGLLSVPTSSSPRLAGNGTADSNIGFRPIPNATIELFRIDTNGNPVGQPIAVTVTNPNGVFTILLPIDESLSGDKILQSIVEGQTVRALVTDEQLIIDAFSEYVADRLIQEDDFDLGGIPVEKLDEIDQSIRQLGIEEEADLPSTLATIDAVAGATVSAEINQVIVEENKSAPVVAAAGPFDMFENSAVAPAILITASDSDPVGAVTGFSIAAGNTGGGFAIDNGGNITVANPGALDRETTPSFTLTITATDGTNTSAGRNIVINLLDVNDTAPSVAAGQSFTVASSATNGTVVGTVLATDADITGTITAFSITAGDTNSTFSIAPNGEISVADNTGLLAGNPYTLTIEASDGTNTSAGETVAITVTTGGGAVWDNFNWDDGSTWQ